MAYVDDLIVFTRGSYRNHLEKVKELFKRLRRLWIQNQSEEV